MLKYKIDATSTPPASPIDANLPPDHTSGRKKMLEKNEFTRAQVFPLPNMLSIETKEYNAVVSLII